MSVPRVDDALRAKAFVVCRQARVREASCLLPQVPHSPASSQPLLFVLLLTGRGTDLRDTPCAWSPRPQAQQLARELQRLLRRQPRHRRGHAARRAQQESAQGVQKQANPRAQRSHRETQAAAGGSSSRAPAAATLPTSAAAKAAACTPWRCLCLGDLSHTTKTVPLRRTTRHASHSLRTEERTCARSVSAQQQQA